MSKFFKTLKCYTVIGFLAISIASTANAFTILDNFTIDLNAVVTGLGTQTDVQQFNWNSPGQNTSVITQYLGNNSTVDVGDTFIETGYMSTYSVAANGGQDTLLDLTTGGTTYHLYMVFDGLEGDVTKVNSATSWDYSFYNGVGNVSVILDKGTDPLNDPSTDITTLLTMSVIPVSGGTADGFIGGSAPVSNWAATALVTSAAPGVFLDSGGNDLWTEYGESGLLIYLAQGVTQLDGTNVTGSGANPITGNTESYVQFSGHTGDTANLAAIPEPATILLLGVGILGFAAVLRKRVS